MEKWDDNSSYLSYAFVLFQTKNIVRSLELVRPCLRLFLFVPTFLSSRFINISLVIIPVSASSDSFTLAVLMREVSSVGYTPRA